MSHDEALINLAGTKRLLRGATLFRAGLAALLG